MFTRICEPDEPNLRRVSKVIPDRLIDGMWPLKPCRGQARIKRLSTSQLVRIHLLVLLKALGAFNKVCYELQYNADYRRFCRLKSTDEIPAAGTLSKFREKFGIDGWREIHRLFIEAVTNLYTAEPLGIVLMDSTDLPAAVRRSWKKKTIPRCWPEWNKPQRAEASALARAGSQIISLATKNTVFMGCYAGMDTGFRFRSTRLFEQQTLPMWK